MPPGAYTLRAAADGYRALEELVDIRPGELTELELRLERE